MLIDKASCRGGLQVEKLVVSGQYQLYIGICWRALETC